MPRTRTPLERIADALEKLVELKEADRTLVTTYEAGASVPVVTAVDRALGVIRARRAGPCQCKQCKALLKKIKSRKA